MHAFATCTSSRWDFEGCDSSRGPALSASGFCMEQAQSCTSKIQVQEWFWRSYCFPSVSKIGELKQQGFQGARCRAFPVVAAGASCVGELHVDVQRCLGWASFTCSWHDLGTWQMGHFCRAMVFTGHL